MNRMMMIAAVGALAGTAAAQTTVQYNGATFDRWNYPFNGSPETRDVASTFSPGFTPGVFDDRDAQVVTTFVTGNDFQPGLGVGAYQISRATLTATIDPRFGGVFAYDPTADSYRSHLLPSDPDWVPDTDAGRAIELFGTAFRNGLNPFAFHNPATPFAFADPTLEGVRNAYAAGFVGGSLVDVSNNVRDRFEASPFAVGQANLNPGDLVPGDTTFTFEIDVNDPNIQAYLAQSLNAGVVSFSITSLHLTTQGGPAEYPGFYTNESFFPDALPFSLEITATPAPAGVALLGMGGLSAVRRRR